MKFHNCLGLSIVSIILTSIPIFAQSPSPVTHLTVRSGFDGTALLRWDSSHAALGYHIYRSVDRGSFARLATVRITGYSDLAYFSHTYHYYVTAFNLSGESSPSDTVTYPFEVLI